MKSTTLSRSLGLLSLAARVGIKEIQSGNLKSRMQQALVIAESLAELKGAAMKAGQLLSLELSDYFPPEAVEILSKLQNSALSVDFGQIEKILRTELKEKFENLHDISPTPLGSASIGQVHRARFVNADIVLKVQYPGVAESIDADLKILKTIANTFCRFSGRQMNLEPLFEEFRVMLQQEVDYHKEAEFQKQYRARILQNQPDRGWNCVVPQVIDGLSTAKVLAMNYERGETLRTWLTTQPSAALRESLARTILDLYFLEFFDWGFVQTDPNFANFLIRTQPNPELVLLDFGACRTYPREFIQQYVQLLRTAAAGDYQKLKAQGVEFGLIDPRESEEAFRAFADLLKTAIRPFFHDGGQRIFDFADEEHLRNSQNAGRVLSQTLKFSPPPSRLVFLHRKLAGVYAVLRHLHVKMDVRPYWDGLPKS